jgi:catechol 2,3-dioxygenase-like lactoylglutathione lyase family enzyme
MSKLDHIGVFVHSLDEAAKTYERLGFPMERVVDFRRANGREVRVGIIQLTGGVELELLEDPEALESGVQPLNHICFEVADIRDELAQLKSEGFPLESDVPRPGITAPAIAFLLPEAADGVRIELCQKD